MGNDLNQGEGKKKLLAARPRAGLVAAESLSPPPRTPARCPRSPHCISPLHCTARTALTEGHSFSNLAAESRSSFFNESIWRLPSSVCTRLYSLAQASSVVAGTLVAMARAPMAGITPAEEQAAALTCGAAVGGNVP